MQHPIAKFNVEQSKYLESCPAEHKRFHEVLFMVGNATVIYHRRAEDFSPTIEDWNEWLQSIENPSLREHFRRDGFEKSKRVLNFTRFILEKNDVGYDAFLLENLGEEIMNEYRGFQHNSASI